MILTAGTGEHWVKNDMKETMVVRIKEVALKDPILVEGLPGVGHVGKLVADHMVEQLKAEKIMEIFSPHFPPQVMVNTDGTIRQVRNEIYAYRGKDGEPDLLILIGDYQALPMRAVRAVRHIPGHSRKLSRAENLCVGGYGTASSLEEPAVMGAATSLPLVEEMKRKGGPLS